MTLHRIERTELQHQSHSNTHILSVRPESTTSFHVRDEDDREWVDCRHVFQQRMRIKLWRHTASKAKIEIVSVVVCFDSVKDQIISIHHVGRKIHFQRQLHINTNVPSVRAEQRRRFIHSSKAKSSVFYISTVDKHFIMASRHLENYTPFANQSHSNANVRSVRPWPNTPARTCDQDNCEPITSIVVYFDRKQGLGHGVTPSPKQKVMSKPITQNTNKTSVRAEPMTPTHAFKQGKSAIVVYFDSDTG